MYAAIRPALRSASTPKTSPHIFHNRRHPASSLRLRSFHATCWLAQTPKSTPSNNGIPVDENEVEKSDRDKATETTAGHTGSSMGVEDPEILAQKLQRSREMTRRYTSALRRTQRRNRAQDLPPIHIPDWFLKSRVNLREEEGVNTGKEKMIQLKITHIDSGEHATVAIPFWSYYRGVKNMSEMVRALWKKGMSDDQRKDFALDFATRIGVQDDAGTVESLERGEEVKPDVAEAWPTEESLEGLTYEQQQESLKKRQQRNIEKLESQDRSYTNEQNRSGRRISPLILAEIRATIAASLSTIHAATNELFPSLRTNLILHSPSNEHESVLVKNVLAISSELEADVVKLYPQDLAQLIGDYIGEGPEPSPYSIRSLGYETYKLESDLADDIQDLKGEDGVEEEQDASVDLPEHPESLPGMPPSLAPGFGSRSPVSRFMLPIIGLSTVSSSLKDLIQNIKSGQNQGDGSIDSTITQPQRAQTQSEQQLEDLKISTFLEALIDSSELKRDRGLSGSKNHAARVIPSSRSSKIADIPETLDFFNYTVAKGAAELDLSSVLPPKAAPDFKFTIDVKELSSRVSAPHKSTIIHIMDIKELNATHYGSRIMQKLEDIIRKRRCAGESIMVVGTTCSLDLVPELSSAGVQSLQSQGDTGFFRTILVPIAPLEHLGAAWVGDDLLFDMPSAARAKLLEQSSSTLEKLKFQRINLWHIRDMLLRLDLEATVTLASEERALETYKPFHSVFPQFNFWKILTYDEVHRISLTALGLYLTDAASTHLSWAHVALATGLLKASDEVKFVQVRKIAEKKVGLAFTKRPESSRVSKGLDALQNRSVLGEMDNGRAAKRRHDLSRVAMTATKHEKRLMPGVADPDQIKTTFDQIHVPKDTVEAIRTLTSLSLIRPDAFDYGVLATEKISGALLYGPPGTGKTLLAKAVAKESGSMVLEVSGSSVMDKYVGEGEKNVSAIFSLARKLSPCIVFLDEADAIFASRSSGRERTSHRDILNQFLKEWDGLNDLSVFVMVATNRPFDLDDAVIRRLPRRLLVDLPLQEDRKEIMRIHLRGEQLDPSVDLEDLAKRTPLYSGSDLKNVAVSAALACVKEENENAAIAAAKAAIEEGNEEPRGDYPDDAPLAAAVTTASAEAKTQHATITTHLPTPASVSTSAFANFNGTADILISPPPPAHSRFQSLNPPRLVRGQKYDFPEKRTLHARHFDKALLEISASISEDMSSLNAVKKFDEQYGDRKGRRKKNAYGFGIHEEKESSARVRDT